MQIEFYLSSDFPKFNSMHSIFFISHAEKITEVFFEKYNEKIMTSASSKENII